MNASGAVYPTPRLMSAIDIDVCARYARACFFRRSSNKSENEMPSCFKRRFSVRACRSNTVATLFAQQTPEGNSTSIACTAAREKDIVGCASERATRSRNNSSSSDFDACTGRFRSGAAKCIACRVALNRIGARRISS